MATQKIRIGLLGLGQVGGGLVEILQAKRGWFMTQLGVDFEIRKIAVRNLAKKRPFKVAPHLLTNNPRLVVKDPAIDVVVELIGGTKEARVLVKEALKAGKHVVTANKALLAEHGDEIFKLAYQKKRWICFEASVAAGIPVMKALREGLVANKIQSIASIINGTSNYILSSMTENGTSFDEALKQAQKKGYAEADPTLDIDGTDAAHKLAILSRYAFNGSIEFDSIYREGIAGIKSEDIQFARHFGYRIKLLAIAKRSSAGLEARVQPALVPEKHILANVNGSFNAVQVCGDEVGEVLFYGRGAGSHPTASAVFSDLVDIAKGGIYGPIQNSLSMRGIDGGLKVRSIASTDSRYYLRFQVIDQPGVLAGIANILGKYKISISDVIQQERSAGKMVPLIMLTHETHEKSVRQAVKAIDRLKPIKGRSQVIRIEG
ncbi:MAG TPA: homoserine dehydrogenase [Candidatus Omnitrophota bacterium]|nr:homoserine dehydrogenase [Candidatus Omnitrophota bacterium]